MASGDELVIFGVSDYKYPATNFATYDTRNNHDRLDFDASVNESVIFGGVLSSVYAGGGLTVELTLCATTAVTGDMVFNVSIERKNNALDRDADSFATAQVATGTTSATSGAAVTLTATFTSGAQMDGLLAGESFRIKVERDAVNVSDTMAGDAELETVVVKET